MKKGKMLEVDIKKINSKLANLERKIEKIEERFKLDGHPYSSGEVMEKLIGSDEARERP